MPFSYLRASLLNHLPSVIQELGLDADQLFQTIGVEPKTIKEGKDLLSAHQIIKIVQTVKEQSGCQHLGLLWGGALTDSSLGPAVAMMKTSPTFGDALRTGLRYVRLNAQGIQRELYSDGDIAYISSMLSLPEELLSEESIQMAVAANWRICNLVTDQQWHPRSVCFTFNPPADKAFYKSFFRLPVQFNADFNGVIFDASDLDIPLKDSNTALHDMWKDYTDILESEIPQDFISIIKSLIRRQLDGGSCTLEDVAAFLPYEKRTLQRKLSDHKTSYQELLDDARFEKAIELLKTTNMSVSRLSDILGYKNPDVFSKAFKKKYGTSPTQWKKSHH